MANILYKLARPALHLLDPERAHRVTIRALQFGLAWTRQPRQQADDPILRTSVWGLDFPNPIGLAAGFDKDAEVCDAMFGLGFGFVEAGTVTPRPQPGNSGRRLCRLDADEAVINRFGFNSRGIAPFAINLARRNRAGIVGANVGKNRETADAAADYITCIEAVAGLADYVVVNISSPNTPGLRALQARAQIDELLRRVLAARNRIAPPMAEGAAAAPAAARQPPLLVKVGPDLDDAQLRDIAEVALATGVDGLIVGNTTLARPAGLKSPQRDAQGGLSGQPLLAPSTACLGAMYRFTEGKIPIIGCGGIASGADAYAKIRAGASLVELYTALVFHGPALIGHIKRELAALLRADGFVCLTEAVGAAGRSALSAQ
jgi:dihydroorotate dehydrogenase